MKKRYMTIILLCFPILTILYINSFHLPYEVHISVILKITGSLLLLMLFAYIIADILLSYTINICRLIYNKIHKKEIIQIYLFPFIYYVKDRSLKLFHPFEIFYNDTSFHVKKINTKDDVNELKLFLKKQNLFIQIIVIITLLVITLFLIKIWYIYGVIFLLSSLIYILRQAENKDRLSCVSITKNIDDFYLVNFLARQSSKESIYIHKELLYNYINMNKDCEFIYCVNELLMNIIMDPLYDKVEKKNLIIYKLNEIMTKHSNEDYLYSKKFRNTLDVEKRVFYENFDLLIIMGYLFRKTDNDIELNKIIDYIDFMLKKVFEEDVSDDIFELQILREGYYEYEETFHNMCEGKISFVHHKITAVRNDFEYRKRLEREFITGE